MKWRDDISQTGGARRSQDDPLLFFDLPFNMFSYVPKPQDVRGYDKQHRGQTVDSVHLCEAEVKRPPFVDISVSISEETVDKRVSWKPTWSLRQTPPFCHNHECQNVTKPFGFSHHSVQIHAANGAGTCGANGDFDRRRAPVAGASVPASAAASRSLRGPRGSAVRGRPPTSCLLGHKGGKNPWQGRVM